MIFCKMFLISTFYRLIMKKSVLFCLFIWFCADLQAQNLVLNPSFEELKTNWSDCFFSHGAQFEKHIKFWISSNNASPDLYNFEMQPSFCPWFGQSARTGKVAAGIYTFAPQSDILKGQSEWREYIEGQLTRPLTIGKTYYIEFWVLQRPDSITKKFISDKKTPSIGSNNLGIYFSKDLIRRDDKSLLQLTPNFNETEVVTTPNGAWRKVSGTFVASTSAKFFLIGNFFPQDKTEISKQVDRKKHEAYYLIDDVVVQDVNAIQPPASKKLNNYTFKTLVFDFDKDLIRPESYAELDQIFEEITADDQLKLLVEGHTDDVGDDAYNLILSTARAKAVCVYLNNKGIEKKRLSFKGFGETEPIAPNDSALNRQQNRRVVLKVVH